MLENLHPKHLILDKEDLAVSNLIAPTSESTLHFNAFLRTTEGVPETVRFEL